jgi:hypothetical protein
VHVRALTEGCSCGRLATWAGTIFTYIRTTGAGVPRALHRDVREQVADCNLTLVYTDRIYIYGVTQKGHGHLTLESKEGLQIDDNCTAEVARSRCMPSSKGDGLVKTPLGEAAAWCEGFGRQSEAHQTEANAKKQDCQRGSRGCIVGALSGGTPRRLQAVPEGVRLGHMPGAGASLLCCEVVPDDACCSGPSWHPLNGQSGGVAAREPCKVSPAASLHLCRCQTGWPQPLTCFETCVENCRNSRRCSLQSLSISALTGNPLYWIPGVFNTCCPAVGNNVLHPRAGWSWWLCWLGIASFHKINSAESDGLMNGHVGPGANAAACSWVHPQRPTRPLQC